MNTEQALLLSLILECLVWIALMPFATRNWCNHGCWSISAHCCTVGAKDGRIGMKNQMKVNVTADHRVIHGADLASFLQTLAKIIEDPKDLTL
ncbi:dihydrolipoyllysine-residue acetyltransferase component 5 of pyruvate dehydrogenase complex, chloroplastic-like [Camellia sinensis]|uniref:dihydrolipoyllysine-residue acetyltransferase component 5 of pyruvate dehydrogenase complex, chloroplastic-like n=1 Tax=Camellia sinensis TaxID=4442 RepID=UPI0010362885|nr:dihydrolipoyllysine-residue acetyltransferase component 5 of pyruvate dehydrogenase complex, chloroplastic-like [Camellia sinensis]